MPTVDTPTSTPPGCKEARKLRQGHLGHHRQAATSTSCSSIPGEATFPVSCLVAKRGGMVVFCAGTSGFNITFDARYVWMRQKRIQGSHFAHLKQAASGQPVRRSTAGSILACREVFPWDKIPAAHALMLANKHAPGNMAVLVNSPRPGLRTLDDVIEATGG